jgi:hypothetical protein
MTTNTRLKTAFVISILTSLWLTVMWNNSIVTIEEQKNVIDSLTNISDSLHDELFNTKVELGRHEFTREYFFSKHPKLQLEYENYLHHETE